MAELCALNLNADATMHSKEQEPLMELRQKKDVIFQKLNAINDGNVCMISQLNETYDEWYDDDDEFLFEDPKGILNVIETGCMMVHRCADAELYEEGYELAERLLTIEINVEGDYAEYEDKSLRISDLERLELLQYDIRRFTLDAMALAYQVLSGEKRAETLYRIYVDSECGNITLENMMEDANIALEQMDEFLDEWICFLGKRRGRGIEGLIKEALLLRNDFDKTLNYARDFYLYYPGIYKQLLMQLQGEKDTDTLMISVGQEAIQKIGEEYLVRSDIALLTADACLRTGKHHEADAYRLEVFRSRTNLTNYLRVICESLENKKYVDEAKKIYVTKYKNQNESYQRISFEEPEKNRMGSQEYYAIAFFDKEFQHVIEFGMNVKESLGWSSTFMKTGIALFLLLLYEGKKLPRGCSVMCSNIVFATGFSAEEYAKGLNCRFNMEKSDLFWSLFEKWKECITLTNQEQLTLVAKLSEWIERRVEGIMQNDCRNYYGECAAFVAAFGEVLESRGESNGKSRVLSLYKEKYPRRRNFIKELRVFENIPKKF